MSYENDILLFKRLSHWCKDNIICEISITCINIIYVDDIFNNKKYNDYELESWKPVDLRMSLLLLFLSVLPLLTYGAEFSPWA